MCFLIFLVTVLFLRLWKKAFSWGCAYSFGGLFYDHHGRTHGGRQEGSNGTGAVPESLYTMTWKEVEKEQDWARCVLFKPQSPLPMTNFLQQGHTFLSFLNSATNWEPRIHIYEPIAVILIQTTTLGGSLNLNLSYGSLHLALVFLGKAAFDPCYDETFNLGKPSKSESVRCSIVVVLYFDKLSRRF